MTTQTLDGKLVVAISSRALFDSTKPHSIYEQKGETPYTAYQIAHEADSLSPGVGFPLVRKLLKLNQIYPVIEVVLLSRNSADSGLRIFNSIAHHKLDIVRAAFTNGQSPYPYAKAFGTHLFLSAHAQDVKEAIQNGCAAATLIEKTPHKQSNHSQIRIAFDGDSVLFSDEAERIFKEKGIDAFTEHERISANKPLQDGPFKGFLEAIGRIQQTFPKNNPCPPIHTALITSRQAPAHERFIKTLRSWNIHIDETLFLGGLTKGEFLKAFDADIFFDDQTIHCLSSTPYVTCGHVPYGVANEES